jgi:PhzF family phenazine biosynthesis protein
MTTVPIHQVDAFAARPFAGNPAAVCVLDAAAPEGWMRLVARQMNLAETAFLHPEGDVWRLRWFTPTIEIDLCGHATLAAAHVLWETGRLAPEATARFASRSGALAAARRGEWIELDFPAQAVEPVTPPPELLPSLGVEAQFCGKTPYDYLVEVASEAVVRAARPDFARLRRVESRGAIVTARASTSEYDFVSRFFAPAAGIDEDPVTGSAHCALATYWAAKLGKPELVAYQASERGGMLRLRLAPPRVRMSGRAFTVWRGELLIGPSETGSPSYQ